jgi:hypothetical protein
MRLRTGDSAGSAGSIRVAAIGIAGDAIRQALRQDAMSISSPQQPSWDIAMLVPSHAFSSTCVHALAAGPTASQKASTATMRILDLTQRPS